MNDGGTQRLKNQPIKLKVYQYAEVSERNCEAIEAKAIKFFFKHKNSWKRDFPHQEPKIYDIISAT